MAKTKEGPEAETREREEPPVNGREGLTRLADLTRRVMAVPKAEVTDPPKTKKRARHR